MDGMAEAARRGEGEGLGGKGRGEAGGGQTVGQGGAGGERVGATWAEVYAVGERHWRPSLPSLHGLNGP